MQRLQSVSLQLNRFLLLRQAQRRDIRIPPHVAATLGTGSTANHSASLGRSLDQSDAAAVSHCGSFVLSWHPRKRQPYESTLPMPVEAKAELAEADAEAAPLKPGIVRLADKRERYGPSLDDLVAVFHKPMPFFRPFPQKDKRTRPYDYAEDESVRTPRRGL